MAKQNKIGLIVLLICFLTGCSTTEKENFPTPTDILAIQKVRIPFDDYPKIRGTLYGSGDLAVILVHMGNLSNSQKDWAGFSNTPDGDDNPTFEDAVLASISYLENLGFNKVVCIGASAGGNACLSVASQYPLAGLGVISSALPETEINYAALSMPKFFACSEYDSDGRFVRAQDEMYSNSPVPKESHVFQGDTHGTDIFISFFQKELTEKLLLFLNSIQ